MRTGTVKLIDDTEYEIWHLPPLEASSILIKLTKLLLEPIGEALGKQDLKTLVDGTSDIDFGKALSTLAGRIDEQDVQNIMRAMFKYTHIKTETGGFIPVDINRDFTGKIMHMFNVLKTALEVNFQDFFSVIGGKLGTLTVKKVPSAKRT